MINSVNVEGFFGNQVVRLRIENNVLIITGDNGNGKTSLLNMIYHTLVGDIHNLIDGSFKKIEIIFDEHFSEMTSIEVEKSTLNELEVSIEFVYKYKVNGKVESNKIKFDELSTDNKSSRFDEDMNISYKFIDNEYQNKMIETKSGYSRVAKNETVLDLAQEVKEFNLNKRLLNINKSLIYFPTYRRIDVDVLDYFKDELRFGALRRLEERIDTQKSLTEKDRRVIGISNKDISDILETYSKRINQFTSESLDTLLRNFVKELLKDFMKSYEKSEIADLTASDLESIDISETLNSINNLLTLELSDNELQEIITNFSNSHESLKGVLEDINDIENISDDRTIGFFRLVSKYFGWMNYILILENLYKEHGEKTSKVLSSFSFISSNIQKFTNDKIKLIKKSNNDFIIQKKGKEISFEKLSTGEKQLFTFFVYTALHTRDESSLVIIDEPELSLHVKWQDELMTSLLERKNTTYLVATHSPFIVRDREVREHVVELVESDFYE